MPSGAELIPLFPYLRAGLLKVGGQRWYTPWQPALVSDHRRTGFQSLSQPRPEGILLSFMSSLKSLVTYLVT